jgi:hypothetical protein
MVIEGLKSRLCRDFIVDVDEVAGRPVAITTLDYPNGDSINLYFDRRDEQYVVSDEGATVDFLRDQHIKLTDERRDTIDAMCEPHQVILEWPRIVLPFDPADVGPACLTLAQVASQIAAIHYHSNDNLRSPLPLTVNRILRERVEPVRGVERRWVAKRYDPKEAYPVDFRVNGVGKPRHIFSVTSARKAVLVSAVVHFLRSHGIDVPTMTIVDTEAKLSRPDVNRLQLASTELRFGIEKYHQDLADFALSGMK